MSTMSRRAAIKGLTAVAAGMGSGLFSQPAAVAAAGVLPETLNHTRTFGVGVRSVPVTSTVPTHLSISGSAGRLRTRTAKGWGPWEPLSGCGGGDRQGQYGAAALVAMPSDTIEYQLDLPESSRVSEMNVVNGRAIGTLNSPGRRVLIGSAELDCNYYSRKAWGADEDLRFRENGEERYPLAYFPVQTITVHHSAMKVSADAMADIRAIYYNHTITLDYGDIGYHLLIDPSGNVYEGRYSGVDPTPVFGGPTANDRPQMTNGAHVGGFNAGNVGICVLGDFTSAVPTAQARRSLVLVLSALTEVCGLDPEGRTNYTNPISGSTKSVDTISGHRDWLTTECPGNTFYPFLAEIREEIARSR